MRQLGGLASLLIALLALAAWDDAARAPVLSGNDRADVQFARALLGNGYPDLAKSLVAVLQKRGTADRDVAAQVAIVDFAVALDEAKRIAGVIPRKDALVRLVDASERLVEENAGTRSVEAFDLANSLQTLLGETILAAIDTEKDEKALAALRVEGDASFARWEAQLRAAIEEWRRRRDPDGATDEDRLRAATARYALPNVIRLRGLVFPRGSPERLALCNRALTECGDLPGGGADSLLSLYANIDAALCYRELGKFDEAIQTIRVIERIAGVSEVGDRNQAGRYELPPDVRELVCHATLQKMLVLREMKELDKAVEAGRDYITTIDDPFDCVSSAALLQELARAEWHQRMRTAGRLLLRREDDGALLLFHQIIREETGTPDEADACCEAYVNIGYSYQRRGRIEEAALAYSIAIDDFPKGELAVDALFSAFDCWRQLRKLAARPMYAAAIKRYTALAATAPFNADPRAALVRTWK